MSMAHGLEARVPLLDHRIVEYAATLPFHLKYHRGVSKRVMKHAMRDILPPTLLTQRKRGFSLPIHAWFRSGPLRELFQDAVFARDARNASLLQRASVESMLAEHTAGRENHGHRLWAVLMLELWLRGLRGYGV
jgi:asparagine synthase (glutamine-hydrolysing)